MRLKILGTVSTLCAKTSGRLENTSASRAGVPEKSVARISTPVPGFCWWICRTVPGWSHAPPGGRPDGRGGQPRTPGGQVTAGHARHGRIPQTHRGDRLGGPARLIAVVVG